MIVAKLCKVHGELSFDEVKIEGNYKRCKACELANKRAYREKNKDKISGYLRKYAKNWQIKNRDKLKAANEKYRLAHPEKYKQTRNDSAKKRREKDKEKVNAIRSEDGRKAVKELRDTYIRKLLARKYNIQQKDVPMWMLETCKEIFRLKRTIKQKKSL